MRTVLPSSAGRWPLAGELNGSHLTEHVHQSTFRQVQSVDEKVGRRSTAHRYVVKDTCASVDLEAPKR